jgi:hypothetical protein
MDFWPKDYIPKMQERPVSGNVSGFMSTPSPKEEMPPAVIEAELKGIEEELGYKFEVVG